MERVPTDELIPFLMFIIRYDIARMVGVNICSRCCVHLDRNYKFWSYYYGEEEWCKRCCKIFDEVNGNDVVG